MIYSIIVIGVFALFSAAFAQKRAKKTGHNPTLWAAIGATALIVAQFLVSFVIGISFMALWGLEIIESEIFRLIGILAFFVTAVVTNALIFWYLNRTSNRGFNKPPPPPTFE